MPMVRAGANLEQVVTMTLPLSEWAYARPGNEGSQHRTAYYGSGTVSFTETANIKVVTYSCSGCTASKSGNTYTFTVTTDVADDIITNPSWGRVYKNASVTLTLRIIP